MLILTRTTLCELPSDTAALGFRPVLDHGDKGPSPTSCFFFVLYRGLSVIGEHKTQKWQKQQNTKVTPFWTFVGLLRIGAFVFSIYGKHKSSSNSTNSKCGKHKSSSNITNSKCGKHKSDAFKVR